MNRILRLLTCYLALAALTSAAEGHDIPIAAISSLGGVSSNATHSLGTTVGLALTGISTNATHQESVGFWRWFAPATSDVAPGGPLSGLPAVTRLAASRPNPIRTNAQIPFEIAGSQDSSVPVRIEVFDVLGRSVRLLVDDVLAPGTYFTEWNPRESGAALPTGVYFARLRAGTTDETVRLVLAR